MTPPLARPVRALFFSWLLLALASDACAACATTAECVTAIQSAYRDLATFSAKVTQTKRLSLLDEPLVSTGRLAFKKPDRLLLEMDSPRPLKVVVNGTRIWIPGLDAEAQKALASAPTVMLNRLQAIFAGDLAALEQSFDVRASEDDAGIAVALQARDERMFNTVQTMDLRFARPDLLLHEIRIRNALGDTLDIVLGDIQKNPVLPESSFAIDDSRS
jgi:outer membrane lipoprotein-sorting protein